MDTEDGEAGSGDGAGEGEGRFSRGENCVPSWANERGAERNMGFVQLVRETVRKEREVRRNKK